MRQVPRNLDRGHVAYHGRRQAPHGDGTSGTGAPPPATGDGTSAMGAPPPATEIACAP
jgi:hypothetical protein